jgi:hypothetical protein
MGLMLFEPLPVGAIVTAVVGLAGIEMFVFFGALT